MAANSVRFIEGDCLAILPTLEDESVDCCVTSPPYWGLRNYGVEGQFGLEPTPAEYLEKMVRVFGEVRRVLMKDGTLWLNMGDSYSSGTNDDDSFRRDKAKVNPVARKAQGSTGLEGGTSTQRNSLRADESRLRSGLPPKNLMGMPWRLALALQADGWFLRSDIIWHKPNAMPSSVKDRPTPAHEYLFLLSKSARYYYDFKAIQEPFETAKKENYPARARATGRGKQGYSAARGGDRDKSGGFPTEADRRNKRDVWSIPTQKCPEPHYATFPEALVEPCVLAGCEAGGVVLDPFAGMGTVALVAQRLGCGSISIELNGGYLERAIRRVSLGRDFVGSAMAAESTDGEVTK